MSARHKYIIHYIYNIIFIIEISFPFLKKKLRTKCVKNLLLERNTILAKKITNLVFYLLIILFKFLMI